MKYIKWTFWIVFWAIIATVLHYTLPQHDVVRIVDTFEKRTDPGDNSLFWTRADTGDDTTTPGRDVFFIQSVKNNGRTMEYRNEDTGWGWPPYFKFNTTSVQTRAADLRSTREAPKWVVIRHYGWRNEFLSTYPNALSVREVDGPDVFVIPWTSIIVLVLIAGLTAFIWTRWRRFRRRRIDPLFDSDSET